MSDVSTTDTVDEPKAGGQVANTWGDSPWLAFAIRTLVFLTPLLLSLTVTWFIATRWTAPSTVPGALARFAILAVIAVVVTWVADKGARRFLPLAALFRLSLVFPDQAPSRFAVALRSGNTKRLEQRLAKARSGGFQGTEADAAEMIVEFAALLSEHDRLTRGHSERVRAFTALIGEELNLSAEESNKLQWAGLIHDVGKLRIDQKILTKPGKLTEAEFEIIKTHPDEGMRLAAPLAEYLGEWMGGIGEHHERYDGAGYPKGLAGTDISLAGRIVAVADAYDVITAARSYKSPMSPEFARQELADNAGTQFDPAVVRAFMGISLGRLRRAMWPLSWATQLPFLGTAVTTPVAQTVAAAVVTLATATGITAVTDGFEPMSSPDAIAFVEDTALDDTALDDQQVDTPVTVTSPGDSVSPTGPSPTPSPGTATSPTTALSEPEDPSTSTTAPPTSQVSTTQTEGPTTSLGFTSTTSAPVTSTSTTTTTGSITTTTTTLPPTDCERVQAGDGQQQYANLVGCDFAGVSLNDADFVGADLSQAKFRSDTVFNGGTFKGANFTNASVDGAIFNSMDFAYADFKNASVKNSSFNSVNFTEVVFRGSSITHSSISATMTDADLSDTMISNVSFAGSILNGVQFNNASISLSTLTNLPAVGLNAQDAKIDKTGFDGSDLSFANFSDTTLAQVTFPFATLKKSNFDDAAITNGNYYKAALTDATFIDAALTDMNMTESAGPADFTDADLTNGEMIRATMKKSSFRRAVISGWDFNAASLENTNFDGARFNSSSIQSANATGSSFKNSTFGDRGLWIVSANLTSASFLGANGVPAEPEGAVYSATSCPNGMVTSKPDCW